MSARCTICGGLSLNPDCRTNHPTFVRETLLPEPDLDKLEELAKAAAYAEVSSRWCVCGHGEDVHGLDSEVGCDYCSMAECSAFAVGKIGPPNLVCDAEAWEAFMGELSRIVSKESSMQTALWMLKEIRALRLIEKQARAAVLATAPFLGNLRASVEELDRERVARLKGNG